MRVRVCVRRVGGHLTDTNAHSGEITVLQWERNNSGGCGCPGQEALRRRKATEEQPDQGAGSELQKAVLSDLSALSGCAGHGRASVQATRQAFQHSHTENTGGEPPGEMITADLCPLLCPVAASSGTWAHRAGQGAGAQPSSSPFSSWPFCLCLLSLLNSHLSASALSSLCKEKLI